MIRSELKRSTKPMVRTSMKQPTKRMKQTRPKTTKIRASAKGQDCTLLVPGVCRYERETVVWCHSNCACDGKGAGLKARDEEGCYGCFWCHAYYDGGYVALGHTREQAQRYFNVARQKSQAILNGKGLI